MNAARLTRRWQEAAGDPARMVEALVDEINDPATGLVTRDFLRAELAQVREEIATLRAELRCNSRKGCAWIAGQSDPSPWLRNACILQRRRCVRRCAPPGSVRVDRCNQTNPRNLAFSIS